MEGHKKTKGRQKIEMEKIENYSERQVTFSKRKAGIMKKGNEISILTGADVGFLIFSEARKPYSFGSPSIEDVAHQFFPDLQIQNQTRDQAQLVFEANRHESVSGILEIYNELEAKLIEAQGRAKELQNRENVRKSQNRDIPGWWEKSLEGLNVAELQHIYSSTAHLRNGISSYLNNTPAAGASSSRFATETIHVERLQNNLSFYLNGTPTAGGSSSDVTTVTLPAELLQDDFSCYLNDDTYVTGSATSIRHVAFPALESVGVSTSRYTTSIPHDPFHACSGLESASGCSSGGVFSTPHATFPGYFGLECPTGFTSEGTTHIFPATYPTRLGFESASGSISGGATGTTSAIFHHASDYSSAIN